jgi:hypothetical protein
MLAISLTGTFWIGNEFDHWRREYEQRREDPQQCRTQAVNQNTQASEKNGFYSTLPPVYPLSSARAFRSCPLIIRSLRL